MYLCPECLAPITARQTMNQIEATGQVIYRMRYCPQCGIRIKTKEEAVETTYYIKRRKADGEEE